MNDLLEKTDKPCEARIEFQQQGRNDKPAGNVVTIATDHQDSDT